MPLVRHRRLAGADAPMPTHHGTHTQLDAALEWYSGPLILCALAALMVCARADVDRSCAVGPVRVSASDTTHLCPLLPLSAVCDARASFDTWLWLASSCSFALFREARTWQVLLARPLGQANIWVGAVAMCVVQQSTTMPTVVVGTAWRFGPCRRCIHCDWLMSACLAPGLAVTPHTPELLKCSASK
jgi:hypothetical protein